MPVSKHMRALAIALLLASPVAWADYKAYVRGQEAAAEGDWATVENEMQSALAGNAKAQVRARLYGQRFAPYVPQYYLGLAAYKQNDCRNALRWFADAGASAVIAQVSEFRGIADAARNDCTNKLAATTKPVDPPVQPPTTTKPPVEPVKPPPVVQKPVVTQPTQVKPVVTQPTQQKPPVVAQVTVPVPLQTALQNWLAGRYRGVVAGATTGVTGKALAHLHLLRAAAFYSLSEIEITNAATHRSNAELEVRNARRALAAIAPEATFYSPRFRQFFVSVR